MFIVGVAILLLTTVIIIGRGKDWFKTNIIYYTTFDESYNLQENAAVKLYNADIGKVKDITLVGDKVKVKLAILEEHAFRIRTDSIAVVTSPTFIGSEYVSIQPGSADAPLIPEGGEIKSIEKKSINDILAEFQVQKTAKMFVKAVQDFSEMTQSMRDPHGPLFTAIDNANKALSHFEKIARDIQDGKGTVGGIIKSRVLLETILDDLNKLGDILEDIGKVSAKTPGTIDKVQDSLATIKAGLTESVIRIKKILKKIDESVDKLKAILSNIEQGSYDVPEVTHSAKEGIQAIRDGVENIDKVVKSLQKNFFIRRNIPAEPLGENIDAGLRP